MGFCLLEHAYTSGFYMAVNPAYVEEIKPLPLDERGRPLSLLKFPVSTDNFSPAVIGEKDDVQSLLIKGAKIGLGKLEIHIVAGQANIKPVSMLMNKADRIVLVRELLPEEFIGQVNNCPTLSEMYFEDGSVKRITERPGIFALRVNRDGQVPRL